MRGDGLSRSYPIAAAMLCAAFACTGPGFSSDEEGNAGEGGSSGGEDSEGGSGVRGGSSGSGGTATNGGTTNGGMPTGGAPALGGNVSTGGDATGGTTAMGGSSRGGSSPAGAGGVGNSGAGNGGAGSGGAAGTGANGGGGTSAECADALSCTVCCDEHYPDAHGQVAGMFFNCGCGTPCYSYCMLEFCGSTYYWSDNCLACMLQAPESNADCVNASAACDDSELCSAYRKCIIGCS